VIALADIAVRAVDGTEIRLGNAVNRPTIVVIPGYYGCLPCRDYRGTCRFGYGRTSTPFQNATWSRILRIQGRGWR
jgi:hypothetical protein